MKNLEWEKEFDKEFVYQYGSAFCCGGDYCEGTDEHTKKVSDDLKQFIKNTLTQQKTELLEEIPKKIKGKNKEFVEGYNNCLDDISNLLKKL